jgi:hypothetical protein
MLIYVNTYQFDTLDYFARLARRARIEKAA